MVEEQEFDAFANDYRDILTNDLKKLSGFGSEYFCEYKVETASNDLINQPKNILDFGCGDGLSCEFFGKYFPEAIITGVDVSSESITVAENKNIPNSNFLVFDGENLEFEDNSFDLIFAAGVFHHIDKEKRAGALKELHRILKKDGNLFIFEHNPLNPFTLKVVKDCAFDIGVKLIFPSFFKKTATAFGFKNIKINYTLFFPRFKLFNNIFRFEKYLKWCPLGAQYYLKATKA